MLGFGLALQFMMQKKGASHGKMSFVSVSLMFYVAFDATVDTSKKTSINQCSVYQRAVRVSRVCMDIIKIKKYKDKKQSHF